MYNVANSIGGNSDLKSRGQHYSRALSYFFDQQPIPGLRVLISWLKRTIKTVSHIQAPQERWRALNDIDAGDMENLTYDEIEEKFPDEFKSRDICM